MKFTVAKSALLQGLQTVQNVVGIRTPLPILQNVLLTADKGRLLLTTTASDPTEFAVAVPNLCASNSCMSSSPQVSAST